MKKIPFNTNIAFFFIIAHLCRWGLHKGPENGARLHVWDDGSERKCTGSNLSSCGGRLNDLAKQRWRTAKPSTSWDRISGHPRPACLLQRPIWTPHKTNLMTSTSRMPPKVWQYLILIKNANYPTKCENNLITWRPSANSHLQKSQNVFVASVD